MGVNNDRAKLEFREQKTISAANVEREFNSRMKNLRLNLNGFWDF